jgi:23S rRNA (cytidine1920-2'-O)/16S rRNA (cytidine1409-2'-O)-methyltransferase
MTQPGNRPYVSRGGEKLAAALDAFGISPASWVCADLGSNVGGFVDCLLRRGALKVYAIDTGYGVLAYTLRTDPRVLVLERTNAMHVELPEAVDLVTIDVAWTRQHRILPAAMKLLKPDGRIVTLVKPHYEAPRQDLHRGLLAPAAARQAFDTVRAQIESTGLTVEKWIESPITGQKGNVEYLALLRPSF